MTSPTSLVYPILETPPYESQQMDVFSPTHTCKKKKKNDANNSSISLHPPRLTMPPPSDQPHPNTLVPSRISETLRPHPAMRKKCKRSSSSSTTTAFDLRGPNSLTPAYTILSFRCILHHHSLRSLIFHRCFEECLGTDET
jgi:hypothetical protein